MLPISHDVGGFHSLRPSYVYSDSLGWMSTLQLQPQNNSSLLLTLEEPQVVDEVAVPRLPTGKDEAQLPGVSAARCRCWCTMCSKQGNSVFCVWAGVERGGKRSACQDILTLMPTWHMLMYSPWFALPSHPLSQICGGSSHSLFPSLLSFAKCGVGAGLQPPSPSFQVVLSEQGAGSRPLQQNASFC